MVPIRDAQHVQALGHEATDTGFAYAPVSQAHGHHHTVQCCALLHCSADQFYTTLGGFDCALALGGGGGGWLSLTHCSHLPDTMTVLPLFPRISSVWWVFWEALWRGLRQRRPGQDHEGLG